MVKLLYPCFVRTFKLEAGNPIYFARSESTFLVSFHALRYITVEVLKDEDIVGN